MIRTTMMGLVILLLGGTIAAVVIFNLDDGEASSKKASINDIVEYSYETTELTTDLEDGSFVRIQFQVITDGKKARKEIEKREFQLKNILIKALSTMDEDDFKSGLSKLENKVKDELNQVMIDGQITDVYTVNKILQ